MNEKATSLIDIFNLFTPKALTFEQRAFYQKTASVRDGSSYEFHDYLFKHIKESHTHSRLLVIGHGGCGKSTELQWYRCDSQIDIEKS